MYMGARLQRVQLHDFPAVRTATHHHTLDYPY